MCCLHSVSGFGNRRILFPPACVLYLTMLTRNSAIVAGDSMVLTLGWELPPPFEFNVTDTAPETDRRVILTNLHTGYRYPRFQPAGGQDGKVFMDLLARGVITSISHP